MTDKLTVVALDDIDAADDNLRSSMDPRGLQDLADSIAFIGLLEPIRLIKDGARYTIVAGHRRMEALKINGATETKAIVQSGKLTDSDRTAAMLIENMQRVDLNIQEQAEGVRRLISDHSMTIADVAANLGVSKEWVKDRAAIAILPDSVFEVSQYDRPLSVETLAKLANLDEARRERLLKNHPTPREFNVTDAWDKQQAIAKREAQMAKLVKGKYLAVTKKQLKAIIAAGVETLSGSDQEIKQRLGAATVLQDNTYSRVEPGVWAVQLQSIFNMDKEELDKKTIYVDTGGAGSQTWAKVVLKQGTDASDSGVPDELDEYDLIEQRNEARRQDYRADRIKAEAQFVETTKPASLISTVLQEYVREATGNSRTTALVCDRLGVDYADVDSRDIDWDIKRANHAQNAEALLAFAAKNSTNLARTAATVQIVRTHGDYPGVDYPAEPEYEELPEDEDEL